MAVSIAVIGHNEASHLRELLPQLAWAAEGVYVDCQSNDDSVEVATAHGARVFERENNANLNVNKSYAIGQTSSDWVLYLDPDERIPKALADEICARTTAETTHAAFCLDRRNLFFGHWLRYGSQYPDTQLRLFRSGKAHFPNRHVHEKLVIDGSVGRLEADMVHHSFVDISQFLRKFDFYTTFEARYLFERGVRVGWGNSFKYLLWTPWLRFFRRYVLKRGALDGMAGLFAALFDAMNVVTRYFKLWELEEQQARDLDGPPRLC